VRSRALEEDEVGGFAEKLSADLIFLIRRWKLLQEQEQEQEQLGICVKRQKNIQTTSVLARMGTPQSP
jgi:hypothetical protein